MTREHYDALLRRLDGQILAMGELVAGTIQRSADALESLDVEEAQRLIEDDSLIDGQRRDIEQQALLLIATQQPLASDLRTIVAILSVATELERIGDYCEGIAKLTLRMAAEPVSPPVERLRRMATTTMGLLREVLDAYRNRDVAAAGRVWRRDDEVDHLYNQVFGDLLNEMIADPATIRCDTYLLWVAHNFERMADRVTNVAEQTAFVVTGDISTFRESIRARSIPS